MKASSKEKTPLTPRQRKHLSRLWKTNKGASKEAMDAMRAKRDMAKLKVTLSRLMKLKQREWKESGMLEIYRMKHRKAHLGKEGVGVMHVGRTDHPHAKKWNICSPLGQFFEFYNLREWVRQNLHRFKDLRPESRMPFWKRVMSGLKNIHNPPHERASTHYQGWKVLAASERNYKNAA